MSKKSEIQIGRAGELIASGVIEALGYRTVLCQQASFDMLLMRDDGTHYRVEVKTTSKAKGDPRLVALDVRRVYFKPVFKHEVLRYNLTPEKILGVDELTQLNETLEDIDMRRLQCGVV